MSKADISKEILNFLIKENRPYALNGILEKCGKELNKATVQKVLDALVEKERVTEKSFGKQKIYFIKQTSDLPQLRKELLSHSQKLHQFQNNAKQKYAVCRELETRLQSVSKIRSLESWEEEQSQLLDEIRELNEKLRLSEARAAQTKLTPADAKRIEKRYEQAATAYRKRKRICTDMLEAIMEGYPKTKKALIEDIGVETDEAVGFTLVVKR